MVRISPMDKDARLSAIGLLLGIASPALALVITFGLLLTSIGLSLFYGLAVVVVILALAGLTLSGLSLYRRRRAGSGVVLAVVSLGVNGVAIVFVALVGLWLLGMSEPSLEEATERLVAEGLTVRTIGGERPALLVLPSTYESDAPLPLVLGLHGYTSHSMGHDSYFGLSPLVNSFNFALLLPNGTRDDNGNRFWNATEVCCGKTDSKPDDVAYLTGLVDEAARHVNVNGVFLAGLSNGGFMSYRLACENLPGLQAMVVLAGSSFSDASRCASAHPLSVLHIHGTDDEVVLIEGGSNRFLGPGRHPGARELVQRWASRAGCDLSGADSLGSFDVSPAVPGDETTITRYRDGCRDGVTIEYWEMASAPHVPGLPSDFGQRIVTWMFSTAT